MNTITSFSRNNQYQMKNNQVHSNVQFQGLNVRMLTPKGRKIQNDQEILINQKVSKKYKLYDQIEIEGKNYTIVGIIQTANKNLPDIYTNLETYQTKDYYSNMSVLSDNHYIQFNDGNNYQEIEIHYDYNC